MALANPSFFLDDDRLADTGKAALVADLLRHLPTRGYGKDAAVIKELHRILRPYKKPSFWRYCVSNLVRFFWHERKAARLIITPEHASAFVHDLWDIVQGLSPSVNAKLWPSFMRTVFGDPKAYFQKTYVKINPANPIPVASHAKSELTFDQIALWIANTKGPAITQFVIDLDAASVDEWIALIEQLPPERMAKGSGLVIPLAANAAEYHLSLKEWDRLVQCVAYHFPDATFYDWFTRNTQLPGAVNSRLTMFLEAFQNLVSWRVLPQSRDPSVLDRANGNWNVLRSLNDRIAGSIPVLLVDEIDFAIALDMREADTFEAHRKSRTEAWMALVDWWVECCPHRPLPKGIFRDLFTFASADFEVITPIVPCSLQDLGWFLDTLDPRKFAVAFRFARLDWFAENVVSSRKEDADYLKQCFEGVNVDAACWSPFDRRAPQMFLCELSTFEARLSGYQSMLTFFGYMDPPPVLIETLLDYWSESNLTAAQFKALEKVVCGVEAASVCGFAFHDKVLARLTAHRKAELFLLQGLQQRLTIHVDGGDVQTLSFTSKPLMDENDASISLSQDLLQYACRREALDALKREGLHFVGKESENEHLARRIALISDRIRAYLVTTSCWQTLFDDAGLLSSEIEQNLCLFWATKQSIFPELAALNVKIDAEIQTDEDEAFAQVETAGGTTAVSQHTTDRVFHRRIENDDAALGFQEEDLHQHRDTEAPSRRPVTPDFAMTTEFMST